MLGVSLTQMRSTWTKPTEAGKASRATQLLLSNQQRGCAVILKNQQLLQALQDWLQHTPYADAARSQQERAVVLTADPAAVCAWLLADGIGLLLVTEILTTVTLPGHMQCLVTLNQRRNSQHSEMIIVGQSTTCPMLRPIDCDKWH